MSLISLHYGGKMLSGADGTYYSKDANTSFMIPHELPLLELKQMVYACTGYDREMWNLELATRHPHPSNGK